MRVLSWFLVAIRLIPRVAQDLVTEALRRSPVVAIVGPRQCGKTTLARRLVPADSSNYFDLEDPVSLARLDQQPDRASETSPANRRHR